MERKNVCLQALFLVIKEHPKAFNMRDNNFYEKISSNFQCDFSLYMIIHGILLKVRHLKLV